MNDVVIEKLVVGGRGLGRLADGKVVLVPYVIPGEEVRIQTITEKKTFHQGVVEEVLQASPYRITPPCPYFGRCGGCHFQHIAVTHQDDLKKDIFYDEFIRSGLQFNKQKISYLSSPLSFGYRQRIRLHVDNGRLGFFQTGSHSLLEIDQCLLARHEINTVIRALSGSQPWGQVADNVDEVEIHANPSDGMCLLILRFRRKPRPRDLSFLEQIVRDLPVLSALLVKTSDGALQASFPENTDTIRYSLNVGGHKCLEVALEVGGFCQVNEGQNQQMIDQVLTWLGGESRGTVLDLFCGVGNFSLPLAFSGFVVTGIDQQRSAIRSAQQNSENNQLVCHFRRCAALQGLEELVRSGQRFDCVLLDPPRAGFKEGSKLVAELQASKIVYISCDQATLFRDLKTICAGGYKIAAITLVDQFCQSYHLESMVLLTRE